MIRWYLAARSPIIPVFRSVIAGMKNSKKYCMSLTIFSRPGCVLNQGYELYNNFYIFINYKISQWTSLIIFKR